MAELDNLIGSHISLISQQDIKYDGILFSINANESSIVLKDVRCFGTEDRVTDPSKIHPAQPDKKMQFVSFPGAEIKDLFVHEQPTPAPSPPPVTQTLPTPPQKQQQPKQQQQQPQQQSKQQQPKQQQQQQQPPRPPAVAVNNNSNNNNNNNNKSNTNNNNKPQQQQHGSNSVGTGDYLKTMRTKGGNSTGNTSSSTDSNTNSDFNFQEGLKNFNKEKVASEVNDNSSGNGVKQVKYVKDDFFDSLSCDISDNADGRRRMNAREEKVLNKDTFGAIAVQRNYYRGGGGRGRGSGGSGGRGSNGRSNGRGRGRGSFNNTNSTPAATVA